MQSEIRKKLLEFICANFMVEPDEVPLDKSMIDEGIIDSFGLVEIFAFLKSTFGIVVAEDEMIRENFGSILKIIAFVERRLGR